MFYTPVFRFKAGVQKPPLEKGFLLGYHFHFIIVADCNQNILWESNP